MIKRDGAPVTLDRLQNVVSPKRLSRLPREPKGRAAYHEALIRDLIHVSPGLLPTDEIDLAFKDMRPVCIELPVRTRGQPDRTGYVDNLLLNRDGKICLVECKLWRNPEAARKVVAQVLDYAAGISTWSYADLRDAVARRGQPPDRDPIADRVLGTDASDEDRVEFALSVERALKRGNFLLIIAADGIRTEVREMARLLQGQSMASFVLALVELEIYAGDEGQAPYYIQPRLLMPDGLGARSGDPITPALLVEALKDLPAPDGLPRLTEAEFLRQLALASSISPQRLNGFLQACRAVGCKPELLKKYVLYVDVPGLRRINAGTIGKSAMVEFWGQASRDEQLGEPIGRSYMERIVRMLPGAALKDDSPDPINWHIRYRNRSEVPLTVLLGHEEEWIAAIRDLSMRLAAMGSGDS